jgi:hypothetical protein
MGVQSVKASTITAILVLLAAPVIGSAAAHAQSSGQVTVQVAPIQNGGISTHRSACDEWGRCIEIPGFRMESTSGWDGQIAGPMPNPAIYDQNRPRGGLEFTRPY